MKKQLRLTLKIVIEIKYKNLEKRKTIKMPDFKKMKGRKRI